MIDAFEVVMTIGLVVCGVALAVLVLSSGSPRKRAWRELYRRQPDGHDRRPGRGAPGDKK